MKALVPLAAKGKGSVAVILPDTTSSTRYTEFDAPYLTKALEDAGLKSSPDHHPERHRAATRTFITDVQADITAGAKVIGIDPEDSATGAQVEKLASRGRRQDDRLRPPDARWQRRAASTTSASTTSTSARCSARASSAASRRGRSTSPKVIVMRGAPTDNNATLFANGYFAVLNPLFKSGKWTDVAQPAGTWDPPTAETEFQQAFTANPTANAALIAERRERGADHHLPADAGRQARHLPDDRPGRDARRAPEHHQRLPVRHGLQADLPGGPGGRGAGDVPARGRDAAEDADQRHDRGHRRTTSRCRRSSRRPSGSRRQRWRRRSSRTSSCRRRRSAPARTTADCTKYEIH